MQNSSINFIIYIWFKHQRCEKKCSGTIIIVFICIYLSNFTYIFLVCKRLLSNESCLCCFLDLNLYSNNSSTIAIIFLVNCIRIITSFFCSTRDNLLNSYSGSDEKNIVFETPEAESIKRGDLSNFISVLSQVDSLPWYLHRNAFLLQHYTLIVYSLN